jgi:hypothetical protein
MRWIRVGCCWLAGLMAGQHTLAGTGSQGLIDEVLVTRSAECHRIAIRLYRPFMVIGRLPLGATRYFYVFGHALPARDGSSSRGQISLFRERANLSGSTPEWLLSVVHIADMPGLQTLLVEADSPRPFRLLPQRDPRKVIVESPVDPGSSGCPLEVENAGE